MASVDASNAWTLQRLQGLEGSPESLTLEFKSCSAFLPVEGKISMRSRIEEAAKDIAAMANEQGGVIVYGVEEKKQGQVRTAGPVESGFDPAGQVNREWLVQTMNAHIRPPLGELDAKHVIVDEATGSFAMVVFVPQAIGGARQTEDGRYWRRYAHGREYMSHQEIEDVRNRARRPELELRAFVRDAGSSHAALEIDLQFRVVNASAAIASFAVITFAAERTSGVKLEPQVHTGWRWFDVGTRRWDVVRYVMASGSAPNWSPITPQFAADFEPLRLALEFDANPTAVGLARLDYEGGTGFYWLETPLRHPMGESISNELNAAQAGALFDLRYIPSLMVPTPS